MAEQIPPASERTEGTWFKYSTRADGVEIWRKVRENTDSSMTSRSFSD